MQGTDSMQVVECPHCQAKSTVGLDMGGRLVACPSCQGQFQVPFVMEPPPVIAEGAPGVPLTRATRRPTRHRKGVLQRWRDRVGVKSWLFQIGLLAWTGFIGLIWMANVAIEVKAPRHYWDGGPTLPEALTITTVSLMALWFPVAFVLGIVAILTLRQDKTLS